MSGAATADLAAFGAAVDDDVTLAGVGLGADGLQQAAAFIGAVAGVDVHVDGPQAEWAMVTGGIAKGLDLSAAVGADKAAVVFCKAF